MKRVHTPPEVKGGNKIKLYLQESRNDAGRYYLHLRYTLGGKQVRESLGLWVLSKERARMVSPIERQQSEENREQAEYIRATREQELIEGQTGVVTNRSKGRKFLPYFDKVVQRKSNKATREQYGRTRQYLVAYAGEDIGFKDITREWVKGYILFLNAWQSRKTKEPLSLNTKSVSLRLLKSVIHEAIADEIISKDPTFKISIPKEDNERMHLDDEELERLTALYDDSPNEILRAYLFACFAGLRLVDIEGLTWGNVSVFKYKGAEHTSLHYRQRKTKQAEGVQISEEAKRILGKRPKDAKDSSKVFSLPNRKTLNDHLKRYALVVGIDKPITFHSSRHTFAMQALNKGIDVASLSKLLGHGDIQTTMIYARISPRKLSEEVSKLNR